MVYPPGAGEPWWTMLHWIPFVVDPVSMTLNVVMFVPLGVLAPLLWPGLDAVRRLAGYAVCASATIELAQLVLMLTLGNRRTIDVNDLIANTGGAVLGLWLLRLALPDPGRRARALRG